MTTTPDICTRKDFIIANSKEATEDRRLMEI